MAVDWQDVLSGPSESLIMKLSDATIDEKHEVAFDTVTQTESGWIVADVRSETLTGDTLWLKGKFGFQNGCLSLVNAAGKKGIEGNTFTFTKVESEKSKTGYAYRWQK